MGSVKIKTAFSFESDLEMLLHILESPLHNKLIWAADVSFRILLELLNESLNTEKPIQTIQVDENTGYVVRNNDWFAWEIYTLENLKYCTGIDFKQPNYNDIPEKIKKSIDQSEYCKISDTNKDVLLCFRNAFARVTDSNIWTARREDCRVPIFNQEELEAIDMMCYIYDRHSKLLPVDIDDHEISFAIENMSSIFRKLIYNTNTIAYKLDVRQRDYIEVIIGEIHRNAF